jgi:hypothetical protein
MALVRTAPLLFLALAGCAPSVMTLPAPDHAELLAAADRQYGGTERMPTPDLRRYCMSAYWAKEAQKLRACLGEIETRRKWLGVAGVDDCRENSHACDLLARELHLGALSALDDGRYDDAIRRADELHRMHRELAGYRYEAVDALGILAVAGALAGKADHSLEELKRFGFGPFSGLHYERIWVARAYMAARDYDKAYDEVRRIDFGFDSLVERTAATYAPTGEADGYRFIRSKSALETGRVAEGKAGLAQLLASPALSLAASRTGCVVSREDLARDLQRR